MPLTAAQILSLALSCSPTVAPSTIRDFIAVESQGNPLAIGVNHDKLLRQPSSLLEAVAWTRWLVEHDFNIDVGIMQINVRNWSAYGITPENAFDPCLNISAGGKILTENYLRAVKQYGPGQRALLAAISAYNTGNFTDGFNNGYVGKVVAASGYPALADSIPPLKSRQQKKRSKPATVTDASVGQQAEKRAETNRSIAVTWSTPQP